MRTDTYYDFFADNDYEWSIGDRIGIKIAPDKIIIEEVKDEQEA